MGIYNLATSSSFLNAYGMRMLLYVLTCQYSIVGGKSSKYT